MPSTARFGSRRPEQCDLYVILDVHKDASIDDIKRAYKKLALRWHPDKNPDSKEEAEKRFKEISAAYDILSCEDKRSIYDRHGMDGLKAHAGGHESSTANRGNRAGYSTIFTTNGFPTGIFGRNYRSSHGQTENIFDFMFRDPFVVFREFFGAANPFDVDSLFDASSPFDAFSSNHPVSRRRGRANANARSNPAESTGRSHFDDNAFERKHRSRQRNGSDGSGLMNVFSGSISPFGSIHGGGGGLFGSLLGFHSDPFASLFHDPFSVFSSNSSSNFQPTSRSSVQTEIRNGKIITRTVKEQNGQVIETVEENGILKSKTIDGHPVDIPAGMQSGTRSNLHPSSIRISTDGGAKRRRK